MADPLDDFGQDPADDAVSVDSAGPDREDMLQRCLQQFRSWDDNGTEERTEAQQARDYYDGYQLTAEEIETLRQRGQPIVVSNRIAPKVNALIGFEKSGRTDPKAYPRTPRQEQDAETATDALRFVAEQNDFDTIRSEVAESIFIEGCAAAVVDAVQRPDGTIDVGMRAVPWDRFYRDPYSRKRDFTDATFMGVVLWMDEDDVLREFPGSEDAIELSYGGNDTSSTGTYDDRPKWLWGERGRKRVRILQHRWLEGGVWHTATLCYGGFLTDPQPSPYLDEWGRPECDIVATSAYCDRQNRRYGVVKNMISPQDEINKRRSKALHRLTMRQVVAEEGAVKSTSQARKELARPDGYIQVRPNTRFDIQDGSDMSRFQGELALLQESKAEIDSSGVNPALQGDVQAPSGRAVQALQQAGLQEMAVPFEAIRMWSWRCYRSAWNRVRQFWTEEKWIRVTDDEQSLRWVGINHPVTAQEEVERYVEAGQNPPTPVMMAYRQNPGTIIRYENSVADLDVDILIEDGPDTVTIQGEQFQALVELKKADPTSIPTKLIIQASSLRNKDQILEAMEQQVPPQIQKQLQELQQQNQQLQQQLAQAQGQAQSEQAKVALDAGKLETEQFKAQTDRFEAVTDRITAQADLRRADAEVMAPYGTLQ